MASGFMNPPLWDEKNKEFALWLREAKAWKCATESINGLKNVHGLQLALHLPEGSEIRKQVFDTLDTEEMKGEEGWHSVIELLETHYQKDENSLAFETWKEFRNFNRKEGQSVDDYIMCYEKYKVRMRRFKMNLGERIHGLNLLCGAGLTDDELRIAMREVDHDKPDEMYNQAKKSLKKYYGSSSISNKITQPSASVQLVAPKTEPLFASMEEYETYIAWKQYRSTPKFPIGQGTRDSRRNNNNDRSNLLKKNPTGRDGRRLQCHICCSIAHFARNCPHKPNNPDNNSSPNESYVASVQNVIECDVSNVKVSHAFNHMILDTGCPQNVAGKVWFDCFVDTLNNDVLTEIKKYPSDRKFKFGGGRVLESLFLVEMPIILAGETVFIKFDVVDSDLPLLLGKKNMKDWNLTINTGNDTAKFKINNTNKEVELYTSDSGHWCVNIQSKFPTDSVCVLFSVKHLSKSEKSKVAEHLHRQYCHPPFSFLKKVLSVFDETDKEFLSILENYSQNCLICKRYKPTIPRPAVGNLMNPDKMKFNNVVSIDLKQRKNKYIIYMIDLVTRYTRAAFIKDKTKQTVVNKIIELWLALFGAPNVFLMDNGGEFANDEMRELGNQFGINIKHTAAYSPWANGLNERNHATIDLMMEKMLEDSPDINESVALQYAVSVRNCCLFVNGFTPAQLAIGQNPRMPSPFHDALPALEGVTTSPTIANHLNAMSDARKAFMQIETSSKLKKALKHPVRSYCDIKYVQGDQVFYKLPEDPRWQGPATVVGVDGKVVLVKHGSILRRVHPCRLQHLHQNTCLPRAEPLLDTDNRHHDKNVACSNLEANMDLPLELVPEPSDQLTVPTLNESHRTLPENIQPENQNPNAVSRPGRPDQIPTLTLPKKSQNVKYRYYNEPWKTVNILGAAGARKGRYKNWVNVSDGNKSWSMDWSDVQEWHPISQNYNHDHNPDHDLNHNHDHNPDHDHRHNHDHNPEHDHYHDLDNVTTTTAATTISLPQPTKIKDDELIVSHDESEIETDNVYVTYPTQDLDEFCEAKREELNKWKQYKVYTEVEDVGQSRLTGRWVCTRKTEFDKTQLKARYVIKGFQEKSSLQSDSPTGSKECLRIILAIVSCKQWLLNSIDIKSAFLQGKPLDRDLFIVPPHEAKTTKLWKLEKCVYGLNDAARKWYFAVWEELEKLGCKRSSIDYGVFFWYQNNKLSGLIQSHVDDFLWSGNEEFKESVIYPLCEKFKVGRELIKQFKYVGINITQVDNQICLDQVDYINNIVPIHLPRDRQINKDEPCTDLEATQYRQLVGKLNWIANQTRPDIHFDVCQLSSSMKTPVVANITKANKILRRIKETPLIIQFPDLGELNELKLMCYSDASLANLPSGNSAGGHIIFLVGQNNKVCPLAWKSKTLRRVVRSTLSAETSALVDALDVAYFLSNVLSEMLFLTSIFNKQSREQIPIIALTDNESLYRNVHSTVMADEHRLRIDLAIVKQMLRENDLQSLSWIPGTKQLADCLTKQGTNALNLLRVLENGHLNI